MRKIAIGLSAVCSSFLLSGCSTVKTNLNVGEKPKLNMMVKNEDVNTGVVEVAIAENEVFHIKKPGNRKSDELPRISIGNISTGSSQLPYVLNEIIVGKANLRLVFDDSIENENLNRVYVSNVKGSLKEVLDMLSDAFGFFYTYKNKTLYVKRTDDFMVKLPPVEGVLNTVGRMMQELGAFDVVVEKTTHIVRFSADKNTLGKIKTYLSSMKNNLSVIEYNIYLWDVTLNENAKNGIAWRDFASTSGRGIRRDIEFNSTTGDVYKGISLEPGTTGGLALGLLYNFDGTYLNALFNFIRTQGEAHLLSKPKISLLSGTTASFSSTRSDTYISSISGGVVVNNNYVPGSVQTSQTNSGVNMNITASYSDDTIYTKIVLNVSDLVGKEERKVNTQQGVENTITLPKTATKSIRTTIRSVPGQAVLLAGLIQENRNVSRDKFYFADSEDSNISSTADANKTEMVMLLVPRVVKFKTVSAEELKKINGLSKKKALAKKVNPVLNKGKVEVKKKKPSKGV